MSIAVFFSRQIKIFGITCSLFFLWMSSSSYATKNIEFNTQVLDLEDKDNIDLSYFSNSNYVMPGVYHFTLKVNNDQLSEISVPYYSSEKDENQTEACLSPDVAKSLGLVDSSFKKLKWWRDGECLINDSLPGLTINGDLATSTLHVNIPQAYMEYNAPNWDPPSRWDEGIPAIMLDYNTTANIFRSPDNDLTTLSGTGVVGANLGSWRLRADWQGNYQKTSSGAGNNSSHKDFSWTRLYTYRAIPSLKSKLILGENYFQSSLFDSFRFTGVSLLSDLSMIPPSLRGYAPEITGVARTNATVTISQQGRILYEELVAPGPFRIQNLNDSVSGTLNVVVTEQDGSQQEFNVETSNLPYLTRPGQIQHKLSLGRPSSLSHKTEGDTFFSGELSWGVNNGWSLIAGTLNSKDYNAFTLGVGRDLLAFGALSFDMTHSIAKIPGKADSLHGGSYRINYSKRFEELDSQIQFAGYRFSERDYMSMNDFIYAKNYNNGYRGGSKELYTVSVNKNFNDLGMSLYLNYSHQSFWSKATNEHYSLMASKYFDVGSLKNVSINLSANRTIYNKIEDDSAFLSVSIPLDSGASVGYSMAIDRDNVSNRVSYYDKLNDRINYQISGQQDKQGAGINGFINYYGDVSRISANASYMNGKYRALGASSNGGLTVTPEGAAFHRADIPGASRLLIDTDGVPNIPISGAGFPIGSNMFGKAVQSDLSNYYRNQLRIDLNKLSDDVDVQQSIVQATLTEGAVGYRKFSVISGLKLMTAIKLQDGSHPPLGAQITNERNQNVGVVGESGSTYISGISPSAKMKVSWGKNNECQISFPQNLSNAEQSILLLPCEKTN